jgi:DNA-binding transcriptional ArsR family regulator
VNPEPPWADAPLLPGCEVIRSTTVPAAGERRSRKKRPAVVSKVLALNRFLDRTARSLHPSAAVVWLMLLRDEREGTARTAVSDLARRAGLSERTVKRRLRELKERELVEVRASGTRDTGPTVYVLKPVPRANR